MTLLDPPLSDTATRSTSATGSRSATTPSSRAGGTPRSAATTHHRPASDRQLDRRVDRERPAAPTPGAARPRPATPDWLTTSEVGLCPCGCVGRRRKGNVVAKTLDGTANVARQALYADDMANTPGLLQRLDPRTKLVGLLALLVVASLSRSLVVLGAMYVVTLGLAVASRLPVWSFVKRVWLFVPLFTAVVVLPATLNVVTPGRIVVPLGHWWFGGAIGLTAQGLRGAALITARVAVSV